MLHKITIETSRRVIEIPENKLSKLTPNSYHFSRVLVTPWKVAVPTQIYENLEDDKPGHPSRALGVCGENVIMTSYSTQ